MQSRSRTAGADDPDPIQGEAERPSFLSRGLAALVPTSLANRALAVDVETDREAYAVGDPVELTVTFRNRLPLPATVVTDRRRVWGWTVDGLLAASDESRREPGGHNSLELGPRERRSLTRTWDGRFKRSGSPTRWVDPDPGRYELTAFVPTTSGRREGSTTIRLE